MVCSLNYSEVQANRHLPSGGGGKRDEESHRIKCSYPELKHITPAHGSYTRTSYMAPRIKIHLIYKCLEWRIVGST